VLLNGFVHRVSRRGSTSRWLYCPQKSLATLLANTAFVQRVKILVYSQFKTLDGDAVGRDDRTYKESKKWKCCKLQRPSPCLSLRGVENAGWNHFLSLSLIDLGVRAVEKIVGQ